MNYPTLILIAITLIGCDKTIASNAQNEIYSCVLTMQVGCFLDVADNLVEEKRMEFMAEADQNALTVVGRQQNENPSFMATQITQIIVEIANMLQDNLAGLFRSGKGSDADDDDDDDDEEDKAVDDEKEDERKFNDESGREIGEARKKKKKKGKIAGIIKLLVLGAVLKAKIGILLKLLSAKLQIKFFLVALAGLILNAARFYLDLKKGHQPQKVIYYEHADHQHHYESPEEDWHSSPGSSYWGRSYEVVGDDSKSAQDMAYAKQKPVSYYAPSTESSMFSWLGK